VFQVSVSERLRSNATPPLLLQWFGCARQTYNMCLDLVKKESVPHQKKELRRSAINSDVFKDTDKAWMLKTPYAIRDEAMCDLLKVYRSNFAKPAAQRFEIKYRSKKAPSQSILSIVIHCQYCGASRGPYYDAFHGIKSAEPLPPKLNYDVRLQRTRLDHYYLCLLEPLAVRAKSQGPATQRIIALDPGVRTFMTGYDPSGRAIEWGRGDMQRIYRLALCYDRLQAKWTEVKHHQRWRMRRAGRRILLRIRNLIDDSHKRLTKWLCSEYAMVLLPTFQVSQMVKRGRRRIQSKTARNMLTWGHYRFRQRLISKTREYPWCRVVLVSEAYTSKTCGQCGFEHTKLGGSSVFKCPRCELVASRDLHAARNILLRYVTTTTAPP